MTDGPTRRELLRTAAAGSPVVAGGFAADRGLDAVGRTAADTVGTVTEGTVRDVRGTPLSGMTVVAVHVPAGERRDSLVRDPPPCFRTKRILRGEAEEREPDFGRRSLTDEPFAFGSTVTDDSGQFELPAPPAAATDGHVVVVARGQPAPAEHRWFAMERYAVDEYRGRSALALTADSRLLYADQAVREAGLTETYEVDLDLDEPYARLLIWQEVDPGAEHPHTLYVETTGDQFRPPTEDDYDPGETDQPEDRAVDREDYVARMDAGMTTLQVPEDVRVAYRTGDEGPAEPPEGYWTDDAPDTGTPICETTTLGLGLTDRTAAGMLPTYPALRDTDGHFYPYEDGKREREQRERQEKLAAMMNLVLALAGTVAPGGIAVTALLIAAGTAASSLEPGETPELPAWAAPERRSVLGEGSLPPDAGRYDFVPTQFQYDTFGFVQPYPLRFENEAPRALCLRGLYRVTLPDNTIEDEEDQSTRRLFHLQHGFDIDPTVLSPLDERGTAGPAADPGPPPTPVPSIAVGDRAPTVGDAVALDAQVERFPLADVESVTVESYEWEILPPDVERDDHVDVTGDGAAEQLTQSDYREARTRATGESVTHEFRVPGDHYVTLRVTDSRGRVRRASTYVSVQEPPPVEILPIATDAGEECYYPPTGERRPATGEDAARHVGYGCGDWKVYRVVPGETYTVAFTVDDCHGCVLSDATHVLEEPAADPEGRFGAVAWAQERRWTDPLGEAGAGEAHEYAFVPETEYVRVRNLDGNDGLGFYVSLYGPRPADG